MVTVREADGEVVSLRPTLLVGADGLGSAVRRTLAGWGPRLCILIRALLNVCELSLVETTTLVRKGYGSS